jgi:hypothetical protein
MPSQTTGFCSSVLRRSVVAGVRSLPESTPSLDRKRANHDPGFDDRGPPKALLRALAVIRVAATMKIEPAAETHISVCQKRSGAIEKEASRENRVRVVGLRKAIGEIDWVSTTDKIQSPNPTAASHAMKTPTALRTS